MFSMVSWSISLFEWNLGMVEAVPGRRPWYQFSLLLMLLLVALIAELAAWRNATWQIEQVDRNLKRERLELELERLEADHTPPSFWRPMYDARIKQLKEELESLGP